MINLTCPICGQDLKKENKDFFQCINCKERYPILFDIPYLYKYQKKDLLSLIEIAANITVNKEILEGKNPYNETLLKNWIKLLRKGLIAKDHEKYIRTSPDWAKPWLELRYREYLIRSKLVMGASLKGAFVLDIGAGLGFDTYGIYSEGANVTALEFSPFLAKCGKRAVPGVEWIGGSASSLPFEDRSFDFVFCNEVLHHLNDIETALSEMLRVLKTGGCLFTTSDSYSLAPEKIELDIFNEHEGVLNGINESIVNINLMADFFDKFRNYIDVEAMAHISNSHLAVGSPLKNKFDKDNLLRLSYDRNKEDIINNFDGLSFKIQLKKSVIVERAKINKNDVVMEPKKYTELLSDKKIALKNFIQLIPNKFLDLDLLSGEHNKFYLLNGLQKPLGAFPWRKAYKRLRLYFSPIKKSIKYSLRNCEKNSCKIEIKINGKHYNILNLTGKWKSIKINLSRFKGKKVIEFNLDPKEKPPFFLISPRSSFILNSLSLHSYLDSIKRILKLK